MRIKTTTNKPAQVFKSLADIDYYLSKQEYYGNCIPTQIYIDPDNFNKELPRYHSFAQVEISINDFNLTIKLKNGLEITLIKYYKYLESPLYRTVNGN